MTSNRWGGGGVGVGKEAADGSRKTMVVQPPHTYRVGGEMVAMALLPNPGNRGSAMKMTMERGKQNNTTNEPTGTKVPSGRDGIMPNLLATKQELFHPKEQHR